MHKVRRANQTIERDVCLSWEMMKHQHAAAQPVRSNFESGAVSRKWIEPADPRQAGLLWGRIQQIVLTVVKDQLKTPVGWQRRFYCCSEVGKVWRAVAVEDILEIPICRTGDIGAVALVDLR